jgi:hypothetical protein
MNAGLQIRSAPTTPQRYCGQKDCYRLAPGRRGYLLSFGRRRDIQVEPDKGRPRIARDIRLMECHRMDNRFDAMVRKRALDDRPLGHRTDDMGFSSGHDVEANSGASPRAAMPDPRMPNGKPANKTRSPVVTLTRVAPSLRARIGCSPTASGGARHAHLSSDRRGAHRIDAELTAVPAAAGWKGPLSYSSVASRQGGKSLHRPPPLSHCRGAPKARRWPARIVTGQVRLGIG